MKALMDSLSRKSNQLNHEMSEDKGFMNAFKITYGMSKDKLTFTFTF